MITLDRNGRSDLADEIQTRITTQPSASEIIGEVRIYLNHMRINEPEAFRLIEFDSYKFFQK